MNDLISRQAAIDALQKEINKGIPPFDDVMGSIRCGVRLARNIIEDLPSTEPERKTGRWTRPSRKNTYERFCSECGDKAWVCGKGDYRFCPNCGAEMRGEQDDR